MRSERLKALFVCGRNRRRSPTAERVFSRDPRLLCRARGFSTKSERTLSGSDIKWADVIFVMERFHAVRLRGDYRDSIGEREIRVLDIPDTYDFMDPELVDLLSQRVNWYLEKL